MRKEQNTAQKNQLVVPEKVLGKSLPSNVEAERCVLAAILLNDEFLPRVAEIIQADDFYTHAHRIIYQSILDLSHQHKRIDIITLQDELAKKDMLEVIGGISYLISLQEELPTIGLVEQHARIVKNKAMLRQLINSATGIIANCYTQDEDSLTSVLDHAEKTIFEISSKRAKQSFVQIDIWLKKTFQHLSDIKNHSRGITGVPSGFKKFDAMTSGFQNGDLIVVAARPSMGKTAMGMSIATYAAQAGFTVGFFSLEMAAEQLTLRLLSSESGIQHHHIRNATISSQDWIALTHVAARMAEMKFFMDDTAMLDIAELRAKTRKLKIEHNLQLLVVDYLQLIHAARKYESRHLEVSEVSRALKALAKELNIPIIALAQLSRAVDSRMDKRPMLSDLRESGAIEQDADIIMFLYRDVVYNPDTENPAGAELIVGKHRNGPTGTVFLNFIKELAKFEDMDSAY